MPESFTVVGGTPLVQRLLFEAEARSKNPQPSGPAAERRQAGGTRTTQVLGYPGGAMPAWATVLITLGGALIGAVAALGGAWLQMQNARQERRRTELREQREEGAAVVGPLFTFLDDSRPETILSEFELGNASYVEEVQQRWRSVKDALYVYAIANPNFGITVLADEFASSLDCPSS